MEHGDDQDAVGVLLIEYHVASVFVATKRRGDCMSGAPEERILGEHPEALLEAGLVALRLHIAELLETEEEDVEQIVLRPTCQSIPSHLERHASG